MRIALLALLAFRRSRLTMAPPTWLTSATGSPAVDWGGSPISLDFQIGVINNYSNDRETYIKKYQDAYSALTKVPELSEWQT